MRLTCAQSLMLGPVRSLSKYSSAYIPSGVFFALCWQLGPRQMKCACNANDSTYILDGFLINISHILGHV